MLHRLIRLAVLPILLLVALVGRPVGAATPPAAPAPPQPIGGLFFERNAGQADPEVRFLAHTPQGALFFTDRGLHLELLSPQARDGPLAAGGTAAESRAVSVEFAGHPAATVAGQVELRGRVNYAQGNDSQQWLTGLPTYAGLIYSGLYPGIDLEYTAAGGHLKSTYHLAPGADGALIGWRYRGVDQVGVDAGGNLLVAVDGPCANAAGPREPRAAPSRGLCLVEQAPLAWQDIAAGRTAVAIRYQIHSDGTVGFALGAYDHTRPLIIDPTLIYGTYLGGLGSESGLAIALDAVGNIYLTGYTSSGHTFPPEKSLLKHGLGYWDAYVTELAPDGQTLLFSTYLSGGDWDLAQGLAVDGSGNIYVAGETASRNFPVRNAYQDHYGGGDYDAFITKFSPAGEIVYSTYLGGTGADRGRGLGLDAAGNIYLAGFTDSKDFPRQTPIQAQYGGSYHDAFVAKLNPAGSALVYSTYLGGTGDDEALGLAVDPQGNAYVTGWTGSADFPHQAAYQAQHGGGIHDAFVTKLNPAGSALVYSTYLGGSGLDEGAAIAVGAAGDAYVTGATSSSNFPVARAVQDSYRGGGSDAFVARLSPSGSALVYSTYLGGSNSTSGTDDGGLGIAVDATGAAYVVGKTESSDFPVRAPVQPAAGGGGDGFVAKLPAAGASLVYATYLGGTAQDYARAVALDNKGRAYITGETYSRDFPTSHPFQADIVTATDIFVSVLADTPDTAITPQPLRSPGPLPTYAIPPPEDNADTPEAGTVVAAGETPVAGTAQDTADPTPAASAPAGTPPLASPSTTSLVAPAGTTTPAPGEVTAGAANFLWLAILLLVVGAVGTVYFWRRKA